MAKKDKYVYDWPRPMVTVDAVVFRIGGKKKQVLLIKRGKEPYKGKWAFPGGFIEMDEELEDAAARELTEETSLSGIRLEQLHTFGTVGRDPRGRQISAVYWGIDTDGTQDAAGGDDASEAKWFDIEKLPEMAFDHNRIAQKAIGRLKEKLESKGHIRLFEERGNTREETPEKAEQVAIQLSDLTWGFRAAAVLQTAVRLDLFTVLDGHQLKVEEIASKCGSRHDMTEKLMMACAAMGLVTKHGRRYKNTPAAQTCLVRGKKYYQGDIISHSANTRRFWEGLEEAVSVEKSEKTEQRQHRDFIMGMHNITMAGRGRIFIDNIDLAGRKKLLDVGGGPGAYSILACRHYPQLKAVVFDLPDTIAIAREVIASENMQDRVSVREGNWEKDSFGSGYGAVLMSNILHGPNSMAQMKLFKAYHALKPGGLLAIQEFLLNDDRTGPLFPAMFNLMVGAYSRTELFGLVEKAGFTNTCIVTESPEFGSTWITAKKT